MDKIKIICYTDFMKMEHEKLFSSPEILHAHTFRTVKHDITFDVNSGYLEITYLKYGRVRFLYGDTILDCSEGDVFCNPFDRFSRITADSPHEHHTFGIRFSTDRGIPFSVPPKISDPVSATKIAKIIDQIILFYNDSPRNELRLTSLIYAALDLANDASRQDVYFKRNITPGDLHYVEQIKRFIVENIDCKISLSDIAERIGITPEYLCTIFRKVTGKTIVQHLNLVKLDKIRSLVQNTGVSLKTAGEAVSLFDVNYISRMFRKYYGISFSELRRKEPFIRVR